MWLCCVAVLWAAASSAEQDMPWWQTGTLYQVYPRSFKDSDGDGVGDLKGISQEAQYLKDLGVTAIWISPILKSPMIDFGYDITNFRKIDPTFGTIEDYKELRRTLKALDIKLLMDLVPNHSSDQHVWFQKSIAKEAPYTDYYVWHDGVTDTATGRKVPPNNWESAFSGPAWTWNEKRQQYYLHQFDKKQPDFNYRNPAVVKDMDAVIKYWLELGVDGFRVDAVPFLFEDALFQNDLMGPKGKLDPVHTQNLPETYAMVKHWADVVGNFSQSDNTPRVLFLEVYASIPVTMKYFGSGSQNFMQPFNFELITSVDRDIQPREFKDVILNWLSNLPQGANTTWVIGNHDKHRVADRFGPELVDALNLLTGVLPGVQVTYNGEEIGMVDSYITWDQTVDPFGLIYGPDHYQEGSRDQQRTPMQWNNSSSAGFSTNLTTWLPVNPNYWWLNVEAQKSAPTSHLKVFQAVAKAKRDPVLQKGDLKIIVPNNDTLAVVRTYNNSWYALIINMGSHETKFENRALFADLGVHGPMSVAVASINSAMTNGLNMEESSRFTLRPKAAVLLRSGSSVQYRSASVSSISYISTLAFITTLSLHLWK